mmetsp:Transcript_42092/g.78215  ORF Transcript_42092/g.78215 Transcript_42092/m.78215 type:complete len:409 (-) Transcript_42092:32-1258(-)
MKASFAAALLVLLDVPGALAGFPQGIYEAALLSDARFGQTAPGLQLLHTAAAQARPAPSRAGHVARASLDSLGRLGDVELSENRVRPLLHGRAASGKSRGRALEEAALAAAALAVAEEAAAARAVGGGPGAELLASSHLSSNAHQGATAIQAEMKDLQRRFDGRGQDLQQRSDSGEQVQSFLPSAGPAPAPPVPSSEPFHPGNPFNPFRNPFFNPFVPNPYAPAMGGGGGGHKLPTMFIVCIVVLVVVIFAALCNGVFDDDEEDPSGDEDEDGARGLQRGRRRRERIRDAIVHGESHGRRYSWCCCGLCGVCSRSVIIFFLCALLVTCAGGAVLWNSGILQPLLAQLLLYAYIMSLIAAFVTVIIWESTASIRKAMAHVFGKVDQLDNMFPNFWGAKQRGRSPGAELG